MGCASSSDQNSSIAPVKVTTKSGFLKITIESAHLNRQTSSVFKMDPYIKLKMAHQTFETLPQLKAGADPVFNESFQFVINSCYKKFGRNLEVQIWDKNKISDSEVGYGIIDLDPTIKFNKISQKIRCFVNYQRKQAGYVNLVAEFKQCPSDTLRFRFETSFLRRKLRTIGQMNVKVRVTMGQQILETKLCKDDKDMPPRWANQILQFQVPTLLKQGKIQVLDQNKLIGDIQFDVKQLLQGNKEKQFNENIFFQQKPGKDVIAGELKYSTLYGFEGKFSQIKQVKKAASKIVTGGDTQKNVPNQPEAKKNDPNSQQLKKGDHNSQQLKKGQNNLAKNTKQQSSVKIQVKANTNKSNTNVNGNEELNVKEVENKVSSQLKAENATTNKISPDSKKQEIKQAKPVEQKLKNLGNSSISEIPNTSNLKDQQNQIVRSKVQENPSKNELPPSQSNIKSAVNNQESLESIKWQKMQDKAKVEVKRQDAQVKLVDQKQQKMKSLQQLNQKPVDYYTIGTELDVANRQSSTEIKKLIEKKEQHNQKKEQQQLLQ